MFKPSQIEKNIRRGYIALALGLSTFTVAQADCNQDRNPNTYNNSYNENYRYDNSSASNNEITMNEDRSSNFAQDTYKTSADDQLNNKIRDAVSRGWLWTSYKEVSLNTSNGVVTLEGQVGSMSDQQKLMTEIQKIEGVKSVKSNLVITNTNAPRDFNQDTYANASDDQLNKAIRNDVSRGWLWNSYKEVTLNTSNGAVTLEGTVESIDDQKKLMNEIQKINGVKSVKSNLEIRNN